MDMKSGIKRAGLILVVGGGFLLAALAVGWFQTQRQAQPVADSNQSVPIGGAFTLVDENGQTVTDQTYRGKWLLVFFGFTHCPDVCPTALNDIALTLDQLGPLAERIQPLFVTVDPERDTAEVMKDYTDAFHPSIVGLTGTSEQIAQVAKTYRVYYQKVPQGDGQDGEYTMDHSGITYVMTPDGKFASHFSPRTPIDAMAAKLRGLISGKQS